jgi:hypothetical protein
MSAPITAEQVVDVDTWTVQIHAEPTPELLTRLCHNLDRAGGLRALVSHLTPDHPEHQRALAELAVVLANTFTWTLDQKQAQTLSYALDDACDLPDQCDWCESYSVAVIEGVDMCHVHAAAHDRAVEESAS